ncbi:MAG: alpha/beta fold hydrolase [Elusimicrobia bacterium]|nr:alpha/beta fold hydrolase [Elusimicrobiota bacterium]
MTLAVLLAAALSAAAAPAPYRAPLLPGTTAELRTVDGWTLHAVWEKAREGKPTVVLLHGTGQRKEDWRPFARALIHDGYGYAAVDLRGHGESRVTPSGETITYKKLHAQNAMRGGVNDYEDMVRDVEATVGALTGAGVPEESIGVMGAEVGGSVAVKYAAVHPKVPFVIALSPALAWQEIPLVNAVRHFKGRSTPILMVHSEADKRSSKETPLLYAFAKNSVGERNATLIVVPQERGTRLLRANKGLTEQILAWIANPVAPPPPPAASTDTVAGSTEAAAVPPPAPGGDVQ